MHRRTRALPSVATALAIVIAATTPSAAMAADGGTGGPSTPGSLVTAQQADPGSDLRLTVVARANSAAELSATVILRVDGVPVLDYEAHRVAVDSGGCEGDVEGAGAGDDQEARGVVRGVATLGDDAFGLSDGAAVQVWIDLADGGSSAGDDRARVRIRQAPHDDQLDAESSEGGCGGGGWNYDSRWQPISHVRLLIRPGLAP